MTEPAAIDCPLHGAIPFVACPDDEVTPLVDFLRRNVNVAATTPFPRGTLTDDGRLDLCKQNLGPAGCERVATAFATAEVKFDKDAVSRLIRRQLREQRRIFFLSDISGETTNKAERLFAYLNAKFSA